MSNLKKFTQEDLNLEGKILVKFGATWCGPCRQVAPILEDIAADGYSIYDVDSDQNSDLTIKYGVRSVPTFIVFEDGIETARKTGALNKEQILELIK